MKKRLIPVVLALAVISGGCVSSSQPNPRATIYDLGVMPAPIPAQQPKLNLPPLAIARVTASEWLNGPQMYYRLAYANAQQPRPYAQTQWSMSPARLFEERIKSHIGQAGGQVLSATVGITRLPTLRIEINDFTHVFDSPEKSHTSLGVRIALLDGRNLIAQRSFERRVPAPTPDANGGAKAMAQANDAVMGDILQWLASLQIRK